ncbi:MAG: HAD family hydrolase [Chloroherpetonaceae bacterium]|nr:HAD family hydrolase [Chloroherpetonaceae bacterium]MCS7211672.1 HAD family hydrolase [Chloroherpetonaceae bacterium]MDW8018546.1 HAD family hydrolase [Chloroherpetonaceae bacterium]MDW8467357.1 HAD family hydrolase [Chloroherpetonaceae bacterium]
MKPKLVLFDIDGTLLKVEGISRNALIESLRRVYGTEGAARTHDFAGKLDSVIITEVMKDAGLSDEEIAKGFEEVKRTYIQLFKERARLEHIRLMTGVLELLQALAAQAHITLGLLTGNFEESGRYKITLPGLNHYFPFGAFADDAKTRDELPPIAVERAYAHTGIRFSGKDVVIIGDTPHDINCAKVLNSKAIAVATGFYTAEQLQTYQPDYVFENFADTSAVIEAICV